MILNPFFSVAFGFFGGPAEDSISPLRRGYWDSFSESDRESPESGEYWAISPLREVKDILEEEVKFVWVKNNQDFVDSKSSRSIVKSEDHREVTETIEEILGHPNPM